METPKERGLTMLQRVKLSAGKIVNKPNTRVIFILGASLLATLAGAAPSDFGN